MGYTPDGQKKRSGIHRIHKKIFLGYALAKGLVLAAKAERRLRGVHMAPNTLLPLPPKQLLSFVCTHHADHAPRSITHTQKSRDIKQMEYLMFEDVHGDCPSA